MSNEVEYVYNNEPLCMIAIYSILEKCDYMDFCKVFLIAPLTLNNQLISFLNRSNTKCRSIDELMAKKGEILSNFNSQFRNFIQLTCNTLLLMKEKKLINIAEEGIERTKNKLTFELIGKRAERIVKNADKLANLLNNESAEKIYLQLRVIL